MDESRLFNATDAYSHTIAFLLLQRPSRGTGGELVTAFMETISWCDNGEE